MIRVVAKFELKQGNLDTALEIANKLIKLTREEQGCVHYDLVQSDKNSDSIAILEAWESNEALNNHSSSEHFKDLVPKIASLCVSPPVIDSYIQLI